MLRLSRWLAKPIVSPPAIAFETKEVAPTPKTPLVKTGKESFPQLASLKVENRRLAFLQATVQPLVPTKAMAFASLADGPLRGAEINALFSALDVITQGGNRELHNFFRNGTVDGKGEWIYNTQITNGGTLEEDTAEWTISNSGKLCVDWFDWYSGSLNCYSVSKRGSKIVLLGKQDTIKYQILN
jgi:hypothetical protein